MPIAYYIFQIGLSHLERVANSSIILYTNRNLRSVLFLIDKSDPIVLRSIIIEFYDGSTTCKKARTLLLVSHIVAYHFIFNLNSYAPLSSLFSYTSLWKL